MQKDVVIYKQAAIDALKGLPTWWADEGGFYGGAQPPMTALLDPEDAVSAIVNLPSTQPEIVRCKNCVNWIPGHITEHDDFIPPKCGKYQQMVGHSSDDYCSFAERITDA